MFRVLSWSQFEGSKELRRAVGSGEQINTYDFIPSLIVRDRVLISTEGGLPGGLRLHNLQMEDVEGCV